MGNYRAKICSRLPIDTAASAEVNDLTSVMKSRVIHDIGTKPRRSSNLKIHATPILNFSNSSLPNRVEINPEW
jgi:hypothetical protein